MLQDRIRVMWTRGVFSLSILGCLPFFYNSSVFSEELTKYVVKVKYINEDRFLRNREHSVYDVSIGTNERIYIADFRHNKVIILDNNLNILKSLPNIPTPHGVAVDSDNSLYVATYTHGRIYKYDSTDKEIKDWDYALQGKPIIDVPISVTVDHDDNVYISYYKSGRIIKLNKKGNIIKIFDVPVMGIKQDFLPHGITTDGEKYLYVADRGGKTIRVYTLTGEYVSAWDASRYKFDPLAVRFLNKRLILVPNYQDGVLNLFNVKGERLAILGKYGAGSGEFLSATSVIADKKGHIYVVEQDSNRIQKIDIRKWDHWTK